MPGFSPVSLWLTSCVVASEPISTCVVGITDVPHGPVPAGPYSNWYEVSAPAGVTAPWSVTLVDDRSVTAPVVTCGAGGAGPSHTSNSLME